METINWGGTPGPWKWVYFGGPQIANPQTGEAVCTMWGDRTDLGDNYHANVRAIEEVPAMVQVLRKIAPINREDGTPTPLVAEIRAILARIDGEQA